LVGFLQSVHQRSRSLSNVTQCMSAVAYYYRLRGLPSPSDNSLVGMYLRGVKRKSLENQPKRAVPMTRQILARLNAYLYSGDRSLRIWRTIWRINLMFRCLLRWDDVYRLKVRKMLLSPQLCSLSINEKSLFSICFRLLILSSRPKKAFFDSCSVEARL